jgi:glyoxylase-like metal-dependent hydrolase (beta-lactamase superfamily II)
MNKTSRKWKSFLGILLAAVVLALSGLGRCASARQNENVGQLDQAQVGQPGRRKVELLHVRGNVYMIAGAGANISVQVGDEVIVVDSGLPQRSDEILDAIRSVTDKHILFIIDTSADPDHTGGNAKLSAAGWALPNTARNPLEKQGEVMAPGASIVAHYNVLERMSLPTGNEPPVPSAVWPTDTYDTRYWRLYNGEGVWIYHPANAHTDGDSYVIFRSSDVVSTGDIFTLASYPVIKADQGGSIDGVIAALNQIIEFLEPRASEEGGTYVIPGHGHLCDRHDVVDYRDMVTIIRGRIQYYVEQGMTLQQVKAAKPTLDYDGLYGATTGPWTSDMFVEAVYRELSKKKAEERQKAAGGKQ